ncbi:peptidase MA family metallohydrolase [Roseiflexus sp.]|uniref:peptidase MA family metallohydrolase n=1 Tax=Roseiflexus sp. TaxID=2562120 RepID=UPI00398B8FB6
MRVLARLAVAIGVLLALAAYLMPVTAQAQATLPQWYELRTQRFAILYADGDLAQAEEYATFVDEVYDEITSIFSHPAPTPVTLRLYPNRRAYDAANPLAAPVQGIIAHADFRRNEVVVILDQTTNQSLEEIKNNVRHELTHIVLADLSSNRLNVGFHEGIAQYVERPSPDLERKAAALRQALERDALLPWSALDDRDQIYGSPQIGYPQTLSIVAFLVERFSFVKLREFITVSARSSGYRSALERTYGVPSTDLERMWREWLPSYLDGGFRHNALIEYDLTPIETLVADGRYADAKRELELAIPWLRNTQQNDVLARAQDLLARSETGLYAEDLARQARAALEANDYPAAANLARRALDAYVALDNQSRVETLTVYAAIADRGLRATALLERATVLAGDWRTFADARVVADQAASEFLSLGNQENAARALTLRAEIDRVQNLAGIVLLTIGLGGIAIGFTRRLVVREAEVW